MLKGFRDRFIQVRLMRDEKEVKLAFIIVGLIVVILFGNIIYLNYIFFKRPHHNNTQEASSIIPSVNSTTIVPSATPFQTIIVPAVTSQAQTNSSSTLKEYFIPLGSGSISGGNEWTDVPGAQVAVDLGAYRNIKEIRFEASVNVPTANEWVSVRMYNVTDKHPVWYSEVTMNGGASNYLISDPFVYDSGSKTYQVQMKTQLQYSANISQSRIHVILK